MKNLFSLDPRLEHLSINYAILGGILDAVTTFVIVEFIGGMELNPVVSSFIPEFWLLVPALLVVLAVERYYIIGKVFGRVKIQAKPISEKTIRKVLYFAIFFHPAWNTIQILVVLANLG